MRPNLLGVMTVVLLFASSPLAAKEQKPQAMAIAAITKLGGRVDQDEKASGKPVILVSFENTEATDADLETIKSLPKLQSLILTRTKVTDKGLTHVKKATGLHHLYLSGTLVTDSGLGHLKRWPRSWEWRFGLSWASQVEQLFAAT